MHPTVLPGQYKTWLGIWHTILCYPAYLHRVTEATMFKIQYQVILMRKKQLQHSVKGTLIVIVIAKIRPIITTDAAITNKSWPHILHSYVFTFPRGILYQCSLDYNIMIDHCVHHFIQKEEGASCSSCSKYINMHYYYYYYNCLYWCWCMHGTVLSLVI